jgi:dienelactone hydrolase
VSAPSATHQSLQIPAAGVVLDADRAMPATPRGAVVFAHGSDSGRHNPGNRYVADELNRAVLVTVRAELLTSREEQIDLQTGHLRFDIGLLAERVTALVDWAAHGELTSGLGSAWFGVDTGAAAALVATAARPDAARAVVSRGGRPSLADRHLPRVHQRTLLIVGARDPSSSSSTARHCGGWAARRAWRSCAGRRTFSRSRGHSNRWPPGARLVPRTSPRDPS